MEIFAGYGGSRRGQTWRTELMSHHCSTRWLLVLITATVETFGQQEYWKRFGQSGSMETNGAWIHLKSTVLKIFHEWGGHGVRNTVWGNFRWHVELEVIHHLPASSVWESVSLWWHVLTRELLGKWVRQMELPIQSCLYFASQGNGLSLNFSETARDTVWLNGLSCRA